MEILYGSSILKIIPRFCFAGEPVSVIERKLDACTVSVYPPLNPDHESLTVPENMLSQLGIVEKITNDGVLLTGADMIYNYEQVSGYA